VSYRRNPPWADEILLEAEPLIVESLGDELMARKHECFREFGCGFFGCVYPTGVPGTVLKITSDPSEAAFVVAAKQIAEWPPGIVEYHDIYELQPWAKYEGRQVYAIWREEARRVGAVALYELATQLESFSNPALQVRSWVAMLQEKSQQQAREMLEKVQAVLAQAEAQAGGGNVFAAPPQPQDRSPSAQIEWLVHDNARRIALKIAECEQIAMKMMELPDDEGSRVGEALLFYLSEGMLLCDVHEGNIGYADRDDEPVVVITDPGVMVPIHPKWLQVEIPILPGVDGP